MHHQDDKRPSLPPVRGGAGAFGEFTLVASDGVASNGYFAHPIEASSQAVVILPDIFGLSEFYKDLARRFAQAGLHAVTIDYYTRELGRSGRPPIDDRQFYTGMLGKTDKHAIDRDVAAAVTWLQALPGASIESIFTIGFGCGGGFAWRQCASNLPLKGYVSLYGVPGLLEEDQRSTMRGSILMLIAGKDFTPVEQVETLADDVRRSGATVETHTYRDAPHGFFSRSGEFAAERDDAWTRVLGFFARNA
jgi:carboxymethylenebutenolidase